MKYSLFNPHLPSLLRGNLLVLGSLAASFVLAHFPLNRPSPAMIVPILCAVAGMADTFRCIREHWSVYHGTVLLSLYMDVLAITMILFLALYPFFTGID